MSRSGIITGTMSEEQQRIIQQAVRKERAGLFSFIRRRVKSEEDAEDILQDVFYQLSENSGVLDQIERLTSWLFTVARNKIIDSYRKKRPESLESLKRKGDDDETIQYGPEDIFFDPGEIPDDQYTRGLVWEVLDSALNDLPENQRKVFILHEMEGVSFKEISKMTGDSVNTLISRKRYAVLYLRERLQYLYQEIINE